MTADQLTWNGGLGLDPGPDMVSHRGQVDEGCGLENSVYHCSFPHSDTVALWLCKRMSLV